MRWFFIALLVISLGCTTANSVAPRSVVLGAESAAVFKETCWGQLLSEYEGTWVPDDTIVHDLESHLGQLRRMLRKNGCSWVGSDSIADQFQLQYVGVEIKGQRLVFVNGFSVTPDEGWAQTEAITICAPIIDGGCSFFGALYDPSRKSFTQIEIAPIA